MPWVIVLLQPRFTSRFLCNHVQLSDFLHQVPSIPLVRHAAVSSLSCSSAGCPHLVPFSQLPQILSRGLSEMKENVKWGQTENCMNRNIWYKGLSVMDWCASLFSDFWLNSFAPITSTKEIINLVSSKRLQTERPVTYKIKYQFLSINDDDNLIQFFIYSPAGLSYRVNTNTSNRNKTKRE